MKIWLVSMECAGIAEAGGVKNVSYSLCKEFQGLGHKVTLFIPVFKCSSFADLNELQEVEATGNISICGKEEAVKYTTAKCESGNFDVVLINHPSFAEKEAVYTYTENEQKLDPSHVRGNGHTDALFMDILFQKAVAEYGTLISRSEIPDILHCQDASTACLPAFINEKKCFKKTQSVVTIHNAGPFYHHEFTSLGEAAWYTGLGAHILENSINRKAVEPFLIAACAGANITTVSEDYAKELLNPLNADVTDGLSPIFAERKLEITGITNGFDFDRYNPSDKSVSKLPFEFNPEKADLEGKLKCRKFFIQNVVNTDNFNSSGIKKFGKLDCSPEFTKETYIAYHGRVTSQKGIAVLTSAIPGILENFPNVRFIIAGQGEPRLEAEIIGLTERYPGKISFMNGYNQAVVRLVTASSDFMVLPSFFEPCGLEDFISQVYGTLPVAHKTGGLNKIIDEKTGFLYTKNTPEVLVAKLTQVIMIKELKPANINKMIKAGALSVHHDYLWKTVVQKKYLPFFKEILKKIK